VHDDEGAMDPRLVQSSAEELNRRLNDGDAETMGSVVSGGGIAELMRQAQRNLIMVVLCGRI